MIPEWLQKIMTEGITIPVKLVITPEIDPAFLNILQTLAAHNSAAQSKYEKADGVICPDCDSTNIEKRGFQRNKKGVKQKYKCRDCGDLFLEPVEINEVESLKSDEKEPDDFTEFQEKPETEESEELEISDNFTEVQLTEDIEDDPIKYGYITERPDFIEVKDKSRLKYYSDGDNLKINYHRCLIEIDWKTVIELSSVDVAKQKIAIMNYLGKNYNSQRATGLKHFIRLFLEGKIIHPASIEIPINKFDELVLKPKIGTPPTLRELQKVRT